MTARTWDERTARALAVFVAELRPAWDKPGILSAIHAGYGKHHDLALVAHIAIDAACDPDVRTPGVIAKRDRQANPKAEQTPQPAETGRKCTTCGGIHVVDLDERCPLPLDAAVVAQHAAEARRQLRAVGRGR